MNGDDIWPRALAQVYATYATDGAGISEDKLLKHTVKASGKMGLPGTKHARTKQFQDYMAAARWRRFPIFEMHAACESKWGLRSLSNFIAPVGHTV